jgi:hypothetical protein
MKDYSSPPKDFDLDKEMAKWGITGYTHDQIEFKFGLLETMLRLTGSSSNKDWTPDTVTMGKFLDEFAYDDLRELMADTISERANYFSRLVAMKNWDNLKEQNGTNNNK